MDQRMKDIFCKQIDVELDKISKLPTLNDATLMNLWRLTDTKKNLLKIEKLESEMMGGNSFRNNGNSYYGGMDRYMPNPIYGNSYDGYSMHNEPSGDPTYSHLEQAMRSARTEQEREEIRQLMSRYNQR